ncbi:MAG: helicase SNF2, partial [Chitinophagaceae bacterium]|nr:helicase SNF2 [Chitinophagaceae bacterium]
MALPHLLKYVYTHGTDEVIRRGKKIHAIGFVELVEHDDLFGSAVFRVKDDSYATFYKVYVRNYKDAKLLTLRCACPYNLGDICRHEAAALLRLQEMIDKGLLQAGDIEYNQQHTVAKMKFIDVKTIRLLCAPDVFAEAEDYLKKNKPKIESAKDETVKASVTINDHNYSVIIRRNEERNFDTSSNYIDTQHPLCLPKVIVFLYLLQNKGPYYFDTIRNWDKEKNKLLEAYGYSLKDDLSGKFEFNYKEGKPFLRVLDTSIKRIATAPLSTFSKAHQVETTTTEAEVLPQRNLQTKRLAVVFNFNKKGYPHFSIDLIEGEFDEEKVLIGTAEKLELSRYINVDAYNEQDKNIITLVRKLQDVEVNKYINRNSPFSGFWENIIHHEDEELPKDTKVLMNEYIFPKLKKLFMDASFSAAFILPKGKS